MQVADVRLRSESCKCSMSRSVCNYYLLEPMNVGTRPFITSFYPQVCLTLPTIMCPLYAPCVKDGECRYCGMNAIAHRKFYLYSTFARKIQKCYLQYVFVKKVIPMYMKMYGNRLNRKWSYRSSNGLLVFLHKYLFEHQCYRHDNTIHQMHLEREIEIHTGFTTQCCL